MQQDLRVAAVGARRRGGRGRFLLLGIGEELLLLVGAGAILIHCANARRGADEDGS